MSECRREQGAVGRAGGESTNLVVHLSERGRHLVGQSSSDDHNITLRPINQSISITRERTREREEEDAPVAD